MLRYPFSMHTFAYMKKILSSTLFAGFLCLASCQSADAVIDQNQLPGNEFYASWVDLYKQKDDAGRTMLANIFFDLDEQGDVIPESIVMDNLPTKLTVNNTYSVFLYGPAPVADNVPAAEVYCLRFFKDYKLFFSMSLYNPGQADMECREFHDRKDRILSSLYPENINRIMLEQLAFYKVFIPEGTLADDEFLKGYASLGTLTMMAHPISWGDVYDSAPYQPVEDGKTDLGFDDYTIIGSTPFVRNTTFAPVSDKILQTVPMVIAAFEGVE